MAKPELGTKRLCAECGAKFYDLNKDPITCPKCGSVFEAAALVPRGAREAARAAPLLDEELPEVAEAEFVTLEEADAETAGAKVPVDVADADEDVELDESLDDAAFIEETEESEEDVSDIIGDVENEEES